MKQLDQLRKEAYAALEDAIIKVNAMLIATEAETDDDDTNPEMIAVDAVLLDRIPMDRRSRRPQRHRQHHPRPRMATRLHHRRPTRHSPSPRYRTLGEPVLVIGIILLILGWALVIPVLKTIGLVLLIIGAVLWILGAVGRPVAGRRYWW